jgi:hypothetical protein
MKLWAAYSLQDLHLLHHILKLNAPRIMLICCHFTNHRGNILISYPFTYQAVQTRGKKKPVTTLPSAPITDTKCLTPARCCGINTPRSKWQSVSLCHLLEFNYSGSARFCPHRPTARHQVAISETDPLPTCVRNLQWESPRIYCTQ